MKKLLFICGFPSGGTDLMKTVLNAHPEVYINGEMPFLKNIEDYGYRHDTVFKCLDDIKKFQNILYKLNTWDNIKNIEYDFTNELHDKKQMTVTSVLYKCFSEKRCIIWGNKTPQNTESINNLSRLFPDAFFLIVTRDARETCLSWKNKWGKDILWCADKWRARMAVGREAVENLDQRKCITVKFEDLVTETDTTCRAICDFLNINFSPRMLEHQKYTSECIEGKIKYGMKIDPSNTNKWKKQLSNKKIRRIEEITYHTMKLLGYEPELATGNLQITKQEKIKGILNDIYSLVFTGNRTRKKGVWMSRLSGVFHELKKFIHIS